MYHKKTLVVFLGMLLLVGAFLFSTPTQSASAAAASKHQTISAQSKMLVQSRTPRVCPPTLRKGSQGFWVYVVQSVMIKEGISDWTGHLLQFDGKYGERTAYVVSVYQIIHGLHGDGITGPKTWHSIGVC